MKTKYEIQHETLCEGWVNCWRWIDYNDNEEPVPVYFDTMQEAQEALDEYITDTQRAFEAGDLAEAYRAEQFKIAKVTL